MVLALASVTDYASKAVLILVVVDLVSRYCHFATLVAHDGLVRADLAVLRDVTDMRLLSTFVRAVSEGVRTVLLDVWLELIHRDVGFGTVVGTPECRVLEYLLCKEVDVVGVAQLALALSADVPVLSLDCAMTALVAH